MSIIIGLFTFIIICLFIFIDILYSKKILIIKNIAVGVAYFLVSFMVVSLILFAFDIYSLRLTYFIIAIIGLIISAIIYFKKYKMPQSLRQLEKVRYFPISLAIILVIGFLFSFQKFEIFGMGQDQGVYQQKALLMVDGVNDNVVTFKEYNLLINDHDRQLFLSGMGQLTAAPGLGPIQNNENRGTISPGAYPENSAIFHGLSNLPALLSITGKIFGADNIMHALTLPYLIAIILVFLTLNINLGVSMRTTSVVTALFAISPIILWVSKASLTEIYLVMIISLFLFFLTDKENGYSWLMFVPVMAFSFFHVSIYVMMPVFMLLFIGIALYKKDLGAWLSGVLSLLFYGVGYLAMSYSMPWYTFFNYMPLIGIINRFGFNIGEDSSQFLLVFPVIAVSLIIFALLYYFAFYRKKVMANIHKYMPRVKKVLPVVTICIVILSIGNLIFNEWFRIAFAEPGIAFFNIYFGRGLIAAIPHLTLFAFGFTTGFVLLIVIFAQIMRRDKYLFTAKTFPLLFMFIYSIVFFSAFFLPRVHYYYYFARYTAPYVPIIIVLGGVIIDRFRPKKQIIAAIASFIVIIPFSGSLAVNRDISHMDFYSYRKVVNSVQSFEPGSIVLLNSNMRRFVYNEISFGSDNYVFPSSMFDAFLDVAFLNGRAVYYITDQDYFSTNFETNAFITGIPSVSSSFNPWIGDWVGRRSNLLSPTITESQISIYNVSMPWTAIDWDTIEVTRIYTTDDYSLFIQNANHFEDGFMWTGSQTHFIFAFDADEDYLFRVNFAFQIPPEVGTLNFSFELNDSTVYNTTVDNYTTSIEFIVSNEDLIGRRHILHMTGDTWQPSRVFGTEDPRMLGIPIASVEAIPVSSSR